LCHLRCRIATVSVTVETMTTPPNHALQRTRRERRGCNRGVPCAGSLSLGRSAGLRAPVFEQEATERTEEELISVTSVTFC
jgi:hypothetical protein